MFDFKTMEFLQRQKEIKNYASLDYNKASDTLLVCRRHKGLLGLIYKYRLSKDRTSYTEEIFLSNFNKTGITRQRKLPGYGMITRTTGKPRQYKAPRRLVRLVNCCKRVGEYPGTLIFV